jgi:hypothetical protein
MRCLATLYVVGVCLNRIGTVLTLAAASLVRVQRSNFNFDCAPEDQGNIFVAAVGRFFESSSYLRAACATNANCIATSIAPLRHFCGCNFLFDFSRGASPYINASLSERRLRSLQQRSLSLSDALF